MLNNNTAVVIAVSILTVLIALFLWLHYKRMEPVIKTVEFYPPDGLTPAEIGYALDEKLEDREIMSMVYYLADKGYITIKLDKQGIVLKKIREIDEEEPDYLFTFMNAYFPGKATVFDMNDAPKDFIKDFAQAWIQVQSGYEKRYGSIYKNESFTRRFVCIIFVIINMVVLSMAMIEPAAFAIVYIPAFFTIGGMLAAWKGYDNYHVNQNKGRLMIALGAVLYEAGILLVLLMAELSLARLAVLVFMVAEAVIFVLSMVMATRSDKNAELMMKIYGFRDFIQNAEYDRLVLLSKEDPEYYYHILPYAIIFGMEGEWSKNLDKLAIQNLTIRKEGMKMS